MAPSVPRNHPARGAPAASVCTGAILVAILVAACAPAPGLDQSQTLTASTPATSSIPTGNADQGAGEADPAETDGGQDGPAEAEPGENGPGTDGPGADDPSEDGQGADGPSEDGPGGADADSRVGTDSRTGTEGTKGTDGTGGATSNTGLTATTKGVSARPEWLGRRTLPTTADGRVQVPQTTPEELRDRRLVTVDVLAPPSGDGFAATVGPVSPQVLARSTWVDGCPVEPGDLAYLTMVFWGFDQRPHTGEMIVHETVATDIVTVFERLYEARFPIEEMRVVTPEELAAPPTGDDNNTTAFVCRPVTGGTTFSEHASGLAIDVNPFHNPYQRADLILPELAADYLDRSAGRPGLIRDGDAVVDAFTDIGWTWGGRWRSLKDYQHFSLNGR